MARKRIRIKRGLSLPIAGAPSTTLEDGPTPRSVALIGPDYVGMKPTMAVREGDAVKLGQPLFEDKKLPGVVHTSPACGRVTAIHRGAKRSFQSVVIELDGEDEITFEDGIETGIDNLAADQVRRKIIESGLWTALRTRPYSRVPAPDASPHSVFITAIDTQPLAPPPAVALAEGAEAFATGVRVLARLTDGKTYLCVGPDGGVPAVEGERIETVEFEGAHPAGLAGTHIHFLDPVGPGKSVWSVGYQDVIAIGKLFTTGRLDVTRIISLAGPGVANPRLLRTRCGANLSDLSGGGLSGDSVRVISGSVLNGRTAAGPFDFLGRYHAQVSALPEGNQREFLGWMRPGGDKFSLRRTFVSALNRAKRFSFNTNTNGSPRAMVPFGMYEDVMPLDIVATFLLRALVVKDTEQAQQLGCLELDEEDLALCTYVCTGKYDYGPILRGNLESIERDG